MFKESPLFSVSNLKFNVIVLAAGLGTRLKPETDYIPKPLVELGELRAIDYVIRKYQYIAEHLIIAVGYCADLLENYCRGKYGSLKLSFSRERVSDLRGPAASLVYALDSASCRIPTLITFCDYLIQDQFPVDSDCIGVCKPDPDNAVLDTYKTVAVVERGIAKDLLTNPEIEKSREFGFTGIAVCHNTTLLKSIAYTAAASQPELSQVDYALDIIRPYIRRVRTTACPLSRILEFGTDDTLRRTKRHLDGSHDQRPH